MKSAAVAFTENVVLIFEDDQVCLYLGYVVLIFEDDQVCLFLGSLFKARLSGRMLVNRCVLH